jgi:hypothetical protein
LKVLNKLHHFCPEYIVHLAARTDLDGMSLDAHKTNSIELKIYLKIAK